jgi:hypothetical protein
MARVAAHRRAGSGPSAGRECAPASNVISFSRLVRQLARAADTASTNSMCVDRARRDT